MLQSTVESPVQGPIRAGRIRVVEPAVNEQFVVNADTLFVLGNGPSLKDVDLARLGRHATLGMNAAYRYWRQIGWRPDYYACLDTVVGLSHKDAIAELISEEGESAIKYFLLRDNLIEALGPLAVSARVISFDAQRLTNETLRLEPITTGSHATLWAHAIGYRQIVLLGIDGNYVERVKGAERRDGIELEIVSEAENPNYFFDGYQQKGDRYNLPNPRPGLHEEAWIAAGALLRRDGARVVNGNAQSAIQCFPFVQPATLINSGAAIMETERMTPPTEARDNLRVAQPAQRWRSFWRRQRTLLLGGAGVLAIAVAGYALFDPGGLWRVNVATPLVLFSIVFSLILFVRQAVSVHIDRLNQKIETLETAVKDLQRQRNGRTKTVRPGRR